MTQVREETEARLSEAMSFGQLMRVEPSPRRVRVRFGNEIVADSTRTLLVLAGSPIPAYYFPPEDVRTDLMKQTDHRTHSRLLGEASYWTIEAGERQAENAVWSYREPPPEHVALKDYRAFAWNQMDAWFEEDDEIFVHARDPHKRVDVLNSSRHIRVVVGGETVAETRRPRLLFETHLPTRYYIPRLDVRMDLLVPSDTITRCPYKGEARYWSVRVGNQLFPDVVWGYPAPIPECAKIENLMCFFNERVDIYVDGEQVPRPISPWS